MTAMMTNNIERSTLSVRPVRRSRTIYPLDPNRRSLQKVSAVGGSAAMRNR